MIARAGALARTAGAPDAAREAVSARRPSVLVTGGAGFLGTNLALELAGLGCRVRVLDDLSGRGAERNARHLEAEGGGRVEVVRGDVRRAEDVERATAEIDAVFHLAAQVAVATSLADPVGDFEINVRGTLNVLEALRRSGRAVPFLFASTSKVYGGIGGLRVLRRGRRYCPGDWRLAHAGLDERAPECRTPFGCSKGAAEQYVLDYARTYRLPATVFRLSCVFGPHQSGEEEQGWVARFLTRVLSDEPIAIHGDGCQVRDVLCVDDLVRAFLGFLAAPELVAGSAFNVGGGNANAVSLLELLELVGTLTGRRPRLLYSGWRRGDPRWFVADTRRLYQAIGWRPEVPVLEGLARLHAWLLAERPRPKPVRAAAGAADGPPRSCA